MTRDAPSAPRRILVTGGAGFIGSALVERILSEPVERVVVLDALTYAGRRENLDAAAADARMRFVHGDITDAALVARLFEEHDFDAVVHAAAESHVDRSITDARAFAVTNVVGSYTLLEEANRRHARHPAFRFLHVSTDEVYGPVTGGARFDETAPMAPTSPYAASKASSDLFARAYQLTHRLPVIITAAANNFGPRQVPEKLVPLAIARAARLKPIPLYGDGKQSREWLHVDDHCEALWRALTRGTPGERYNLPGATEQVNALTVVQIADAVDAAMGRPPGTARACITHVEDRKAHDVRYALDGSKAERELGFRARRTFASELEGTVRWYLAHGAWVASFERG